MNTEWGHDINFIHSLANSVKAISVFFFFFQIVIVQCNEPQPVFGFSIHSYHLASAEQMDPFSNSILRDLYAIVELFLSAVTQFINQHFIDLCFVRSF